MSDTLQSIQQLSTLQSCVAGRQARWDRLQVARTNHCQYVQAEQQTATAGITVSRVCKVVIRSEGYVAALLEGNHELGHQSHHNDDIKNMIWMIWHSILRLLVTSLHYCVTRLDDDDK